MTGRQDFSRSITFQHLEALTALADTGSFSRAARRLHLSQPSLTRHIQNLEELAGMPLLVRQREGGILTAEGRLLCDFARQILRLREEAWDRIANSRGTGKGRIQIAASTIPATYILPGVIAAWHRLQPAVTVSVRTQDSDETLQAGTSRPGGDGADREKDGPPRRRLGSPVERPHHPRGVSGPSLGRGKGAFPGTAGGIVLYCKRTGLGDPGDPGDLSPAATGLDPPRSAACAW
jgi:molybdate transport repressor ModE-like protein